MPKTAQEMMRMRTKLSGRQAGRAARYQAIQHALDLAKKRRAGTKAAGLQASDVDVEKEIKGY